MAAVGLSTNHSPILYAEMSSRNHISIPSFFSFSTCYFIFYDFLYSKNTSVMMASSSASSCSCSCPICSSFSSTSSFSSCSRLLLYFSSLSLHVLLLLSFPMSSLAVPFGRMHLNDPFLLFNFLCSVALKVRMRMQLAPSSSSFSPSSPFFFTIC